MEVKNAIDILRSGGVVIYPTETFYAIGCVVKSKKAIERIIKIKKRPVNKPLPLIIGSLSQLKQLTRYQTFEFQRLIEMFWPGPLSVLIPGLDRLSPFVLDKRGYVCVRMTPHPVARRLCIESESPLVSTSANISGGKPVSKPEELDIRLIEQVDLVITLPPFPKGGLPSTIVEFIGIKKVKVVREGAVLKKRLIEAGFEVV